MKTSILITICFLSISASINAEQQSTKAEQIIQNYLKLPFPEEDRLGQARQERLSTLNELTSVPNEAIETIGRILPKVKNPQQRIELAELLGNKLQTKKSSEILCGLLKDTDDQVRWQAIQSIRMLARRTDRIGPKRIQRIPDSRSGAEKEKAMLQASQQGRAVINRQTIQPQDERLEDFVEFAPKVEGLVPFLISAANDSIESNRIIALYALADTRDPFAVTELRNRLKDSSEKVQLYAACFLTEYQDASGLFVMKSALTSLNKTEPETSDYEFEFYSQAEMLLASFERITGKSLGQIPMNPSLSSDTKQIEQIKRTYNNLLRNWSQWWLWEPKAEE